MKIIGLGHCVILLCDRWYPKSEVAALAEQFENLEVICNARVDTALYGFSPAKTSKKDHPRKSGSQIRLEDIILSEMEGDDWLIGVVLVITNLWKGRDIRPGYRAQKRKGEPSSVFMHG